ncbi:MAG: sialidase family protein [Candidatus Cybelea sp.]
MTLRITLAAIAIFLLAACGGESRAPAQDSASAAIFAPPQRIGYRAGDDWEPATIADRAGHLYAAFAHADVSRERRGSYHTRMLVQRSDDGGVTWNVPVPIAAPAPRRSEGQFDPWFALAPDGTTLMLGFLQGYPKAPVDVVTSRNLGKTWSAPPKSISRLPPPLDKVVLASRGALMAIAYTDYKSHIVASISTDSGETWSTHVIFTIPGLTGSSQMLVSGGGIDSRNDIFFTWDATWDANHKPAPAAVWITKSADLGTNWTTTNIGSSGLPPACGQCDSPGWIRGPAPGTHTTGTAPTAAERFARLALRSRPKAPRTSAFPTATICSSPSIRAV